MVIIAKATWAWIGRRPLDSGVFFFFHRESIAYPFEELCQQRSRWWFFGGCTGLGAPSETSAVNELFFIVGRSLCEVLFFGSTRGCFAHSLRRVAS
jgi:hypothetical protein